MAAEAETLTFAEHIYELRRRLMWSLLFVAVGAGIGYALHDKILVILQQPLSDSLYYTAPTGAFSFIIKVCVVFGFITALPMVVYQVFAFFGPLLSKKKRRGIVNYVFMSVLLALAGIAFAYFVSLPAALHFLVNFGGDNADIQALITADEYFNFVLAYVAGFAALFQLPLVISFINRMKPLKPAQLMGGTRYVVLGSFVAAAIITPTPDPLNQAIMAGPIILLYFFSILVVMVTNLARNRRKKPSVVPDVPLSQIDEILADKQSLSIPELAVAPLAVPAAPTTPLVARPVSPRPVAAMPTGRPPRRQPSSMDMLVVRPAPSRPMVATTPRRQSSPPRPRVAAPPRRTAPRPVVSMGLISDFIPASE